MVKVGIVGIGSMGIVMLKKFVEVGYEVFVNDINIKSVEKAVELGAKSSATPKELAKKADVIIIILPGPSQVLSVFKGENGLLEGGEAGKVFIDMSTVDPFTTQKNKKQAKNKNIGYLDAPILGRPQMCGKWTLPVGGTKKDLEKVKTVFDVVADEIIHVGSSGSGNIIKVLNNLMFGAINSITAEIMAFSQELGMEAETLYNTIADSGAASISGLFQELGPKIINRDFQPTVTTDVIHENLKLGIDMAKEIDFPMLVTESNQKVNEIARAKGWGKLDSSSTIKVYENLIKKEN
ncbi:NAD(P)-dependent oxidoreductase [Halanaerobium sp. Z-7514]|uniref:NAD(P)-dependent oxidoreductase n=1 Tax=Halanaerobium polyolivorans TaxID=2886943 RepID=A0AAW4X1Q9_9FIRM|nr:NAD(P)-dependent oxidoreductase [Halanaerobium polyolivorans]MCC3145777.1 NAD(P)-dependent oxidoreductase [Halanaerobium polyolivorans]